MGAGAGRGCSDHELRLMKGGGEEDRIGRASDHSTILKMCLLSQQRIPHGVSLLRPGMGSCWYSPPACPVIARDSPAQRGLHQGHNYPLISLATPSPFLLLVCRLLPDFLVFKFLGHLSLDLFLFIVTPHVPC